MLDPLCSAQQSDGEWFWFKNVEHYVEHLHVRLPDRLVERIRARQYRPPA